MALVEAAIVEFHGAGDDTTRAAAQRAVAGARRPTIMLGLVFVLICASDALLRERADLGRRRSTRPTR
jgi:hypothetical protein